MLIANDAADATTAAISPIEGAILFLGGQLFTLHYNGGDGNDVVLANGATPTTVYVDDDWNVLTDGTIIADADPVALGSQPAVYGIDAFDTIQEGVNAVAVGGTVKVNSHGSNAAPSGAYAESVSITKALTLDGNAISGQEFEIAEALPAARSARALRRRAPHGARAR